MMEKVRENDYQIEKKSNKLKYSKEMIKTVLFLAIPVMFENILHVMVGVVDVYFVGKIGTEAIAGVGITNVIMNIYIAFFIGIGVGTTAIVSRSVGSGKLKTANDALKQSIILAVMIGLMIGLINLVFSKKILMLLGGDDGVIQYALPYFKVVAVPSIFLCLVMTLSSALRGAGDTKTPMRVALIANIINVILDYILIFGIFNFNGFGVVGAGLATTISRLFSLVALLYVINSKKTKLKINIFSKWKIEKKIFKAIMKIGLPAGAEKLIMRLGQLTYIGMIIKLGTSIYASHSIGGTIGTLSYLPGSGFAVAASTLVGQNLGAKKPEYAEKYGMLSYMLGALFMGLIGMIFFFFGYPLASLFTKDIAVIELVSKVLKISGAIESLTCITIVITAALQGAGDTKFPMYLTFSGIWIFRVLGIYIVGIKLNLGLVGIWLVVAFDIITRGIVLMIRFKKGKWKDISILD